MHLDSVLIVDDMKLSRLKLSQLCRKIGFKNILESESADEAWIKLSTGSVKPDLILTDYYMPGTNGLELLEKVRALTATSMVPVIFVTSESERSLMVEAISKGVSDFVTKPFSEQELCRKIKAVLAEPG